MRLRTAATPLLALVASCGDALAPLPAEGPPREFSYTVAGFAPYTQVRVAGDTVVLASRVYTAQGASLAETRRVPSADEWRAFWRAAADAGVRRWPDRCPDGDGLYDGPSVEFVLAWAGERRSGVYLASVPTAAGRCSTSNREAVSRLGLAALELAGVYVAVAQ